MQNEYDKNLRNSNPIPLSGFNKAECQRCGLAVVNLEIKRLEHYLECGTTFQNEEELFKERQSPKGGDGIFYSDE